MHLKNFGCKMKSNTLAVVLISFYNQSLLDACEVLDVAQIIIFFNKTSKRLLLEFSENQPEVGPTSICHCEIT